MAANLPNEADVLQSVVAAALHAGSPPSQTQPASPSSTPPGAATATALPRAASAAADDAVNGSPAPVPERPTSSHSGAAAPAAATAPAAAAAAHAATTTTTTTPRPETPTAPSPSAADMVQVTPVPVPVVPGQPSRPAETPIPIPTPGQAQPQKPQQPPQPQPQQPQQPLPSPRPRSPVRPPSQVPTPVPVPVPVPASRVTAQPPPLRPPFSQTPVPPPVVPTSSRQSHHPPRPNRSPTTLAPPPPPPRQQQYSHSQPQPQPQAHSQAREQPRPQSQQQQQPRHVQHPQHPQHVVPTMATTARPPDPRIAHRSSAIVEPPPPLILETSIVDASRTFSHLSPGRDHFHDNPKFQEDFFRLSYAIQQSLSESVRCAVREHWEKCMLGSDFHQAFMLNVLFDRVSPDTARRCMQRFGKNVVEAAKHDIIEIMTTADLDALSESILAKASDRFLDMALERRLRTIEAKPLINALARAERLGYEPDDIVEETVAHGQESVIPQQHQPALQPPAPAPATPAPPAPPAPGPAKAPMFQCNRCNRTFYLDGPYVYHMANHICEQRPADTRRGFKYACSMCGQGFTSTAGAQQHKSINACRGFYVSPSAPLPVFIPPPDTRKEQYPTNTATPPAQKAGRGRPPKYPPAEPQAHGQARTHAVQAEAQRQSSSPAAPTPGRSPYAHLTDEQLNALNEELKTVEIMYAERMRQAELLDDPVERRNRLEGLRNSFGTRQSIIRKRYGVRLRERRTRAEIDAERARMSGRDPSFNAATMTTTTVADWTSSSQRSTPASSQVVEGDIGGGYNGERNGDRRGDREAKRARMSYGQSGSAVGYNGDDAAYDSRAQRGTAAADTELRHKAPTAPGAYAEAAAGAEAYSSAAAAAAAAAARGSPDEDAMSDSSSDNDDIPARLPDVVRQSLSVSGV
ncbi:Zinc finger, C2H2 [Niveomyces insectorum RCEF 264]|uniref:Zinc finger, C2H2 n=1 Tax=Niveomyces insectorum RCEF 264 TaxID=1081102 RepID=A0A167XXB1_9HYPO|nr:Zinc finger, C2H2 [Niveomyces insectorum RCEF 264]